MNHFHDRPLCELCGSSRTITLLSRPFMDPALQDFLQTYYTGRVPMDFLEGGTHEICRCRECGFLWQRWVLDEEGLMKLYSEWISSEGSLAKKQKDFDAIFSGYTREMLLIARFFPAKAPGDIRVLDYGMGWGVWCRRAKAFGFDTAGYEISEERKRHARGNGITVLDSFDELSARRFDFINSEQCFEHVTEPLKLLRTLVSSLAPGGVVRIAVPDAGRKVSELSRPDWKPSKGPFQPLEHISCFTHATLLRLGKEAGLTVLHRPLFPLRARSFRSLLLSIGASVYYRFFGTVLYFRKGGV